MNETHQEASVGRLLVLDLETAPNPSSVSIVPRGREISRVALHHVKAYSTLAATQGEDGNWTAFSLESVTNQNEFDLLMKVDTTLAELVEANGTLVTYHGMSHDLAVLRRRAAAHWMFGLPGLGSIDRIAHRDLLRIHAKDRRAAFPGLRDACAGYGIPTDHNLVGPKGTISAKVRKSQVDCVATFLLTLYELAIDRGDETPLVRGWSALADYLATPGIQGPHLDQFRWHPLLAAALADDE